VSTVDEGLASDTAQFVTFTLGDERYGIPMDQVREIIRVPRLVRVPLGPPSLRGVANLRGRVLPVISIRGCCGLAEAEHTDATRVIVIGVAGIVGLVVDRVSSVLSMDAASVETVGGGDAMLDSEVVAGVMRTPDGMVTAVDVEQVIRSRFPRLGQAVRDAGNPAGAAAPGAGIDGARHGEPDAVPPEREDDADMDDDRRDEALLVVFWLDGEQYAVDIDHVREVIRVPRQLVRVPNAPGNVQGLLSLRGGVLPVVDLRGRLGLPAAERDGRQRIIVLTRDGEGGPRTGFIVDSVLEVARVPRRSIEPAPELSLGRAAVVSTVANLVDESRLLLIAEAAQLVGGTPGRDRPAAGPDPDPDSDAAPADEAVLATARA
jgi:purine-binding chemotaxis protein CheW